jgi:2-C-methyl-D-erythritol 4-phosphate cytidylyltransferase
VTRDKVAAIVVGAGSGQRMGADKMFMELAGRPVLAWCVDTLQACAAVDDIIIVLHESKIGAGKKLAGERDWGKVVALCAGGRLRQDSVRNGLAHVKDCGIVLVQDGARPFLTDKLITDGIEAARQYGAAVAAVPVKDTIKVADSQEMAAATMNRPALRAVQTPQVFRADLLVRAYASLGVEVTDDAAVVERIGFKVKLYPGDYSNIKVTTPQDLVLAELLARDWKSCRGVPSGAPASAMDGPEGPSLRTRSM